MSIKSSLYHYRYTYKKSSIDFTDIYITYQAKRNKDTVFSFDKDIQKLLLN